MTQTKPPSPFSPYPFSPSEQKRLDVYRQAIQDGFYSDHIKKITPIPDLLQSTPVTVSGE